jgi:ubiquinone/menaquinone biosynthesis C-methylase UbiE
MNLWDQIIFEYDPKNSTRRIWTRPSLWIEMFENALNGCHKILDVGCGAGFLAIPLAEKFKVHGTDLSQKMLNLAAKRAKESNVNIDFTCADSHSLPFEDNFFDAAYCRFALWPLDEPEKALKGMIRVVRPGGRIVIVEVDRLKKYEGYKMSFKSKIFYSIFRVITSILMRRKDTRKVWKDLMENTRSNPPVNLKMVKESLEKQGCKILTFDTEIRKKTYTFIGKLMNSEHEEYFLCVAEKGE